MRFIYQYRFVATVVAVGMLIAAVYHAVRSPEKDWKNQRVPVTLTQEDRDWIQKNPVITVGVDLDFAPIEQLDKNQHYAGVTADFLHLISRETGLTFSIDKAHTWDQSLARMRAGKIHMLGAAVPSSQRRQYMDFTQPYAWLSGVIIVRKTVSEPMTLEKLRGMKVAVVADYIWKDILEASHPYLSLSPSQDIEAALKKVSFGMADAMVEYMATASHHIERLGISNLKISGDTLSVVDICFAVNKAEPQLTRILNHVLSQTPEEQKKALLRKWISLAFSKSSNLQWLTRILFPTVALIILGLVVIIIWNQSLQRQVIHRTEKLKEELIQRTVMEKALRENEEKYRSIFENIQDVYFEIRPLGKVLEISPSVEKVFGYKREKLLHQSISRIFASLDEFRNMRYRAVRDEHLIDHETLLVAPDGRHLNCAMNTTLVKDESGNPAKIIGSIHNITERVKAQKALRASYNELEKRVQERTAQLSRTNKALNLAKEAADAATLAKSNFLANMSHEIRTPLSGVISASELVMAEALPKGVAKYIDIIRTSGHALLNVIDDILDFSKIEAGKLDLEHHPFDLNQLIDRTTGLFKHRFMEKQIRFHQEIEPDIPVHLKGDSFRIQQILTNLLSNAVKFTDREGNISLNVSKSYDSSADGSVSVQFLVEDSGIGISPKHQEILFSPFAQVDASTTRKYGGSGLGLSICRQLVEAMHGSIRVESTLGLGSRFSFTLPLEQEPGVTAPKDSGRKPALSLEGFKALLQDKAILVVEDTPTNQEIILAVLELVGISAVLTENGDSAVAAVAKGHFDAVLMDLQMPMMDGFEATKAIRNLEKGKNLPVIAMTAHALKEDEDRCMAAGMDGYIAKPINQEKLFTTLVRHIHGSAGTPLPGAGKDAPAPDAEKLTEDTSGRSPLPDSLPGIEIRRTMETLGVSSKVFLRILTTFYRDTPTMISQIKEAWRNGDRETVIRIIHSMKGAASGIGAPALHRMTLELETLCRQAQTLPDMAGAGLSEIEALLKTVRTDIRTLTKVQDSGKDPEPQKNTVEPSAFLPLLDELAQALEFPELTELERLTQRLNRLSGHPLIPILTDQLRSHDHDLARQTVLELHTQIRG